MRNEKNIQIENTDNVANIFGQRDENIRVLEDAFHVQIISRDDSIKISGDEEGVNKAFQIVKRLEDIARIGEVITKQNVVYLTTLAASGQLGHANGYLEEYVCLTARGKQIKWKTLGQKKYIEEIQKKDITFSIGPAGTGKTFLAVALAVTAFRNKQVDRIILTRPAVEAGEKLGFLPGDLQNKVDPYLRPLYDSLHEIMGSETFLRNLEKGLIEVAPLAYMRGRTLDDSFIILDEAQNTTPEQMKMFLTRLGFGSKIVVTGDVTQIDLPGDKRSGLKEVVKILKDVPGIGIVNLTEKDVVRHELVQKIITAYEKYEKAKPKQINKSPSGGKNKTK